MRLSLIAAALLIILAVVLGVVLWPEPDNPAAEQDLTISEAVDLIGCSDEHTLAWHEAEKMLRAGPATAGVRCWLGERPIDVFRMGRVGASMGFGSLNRDAELFAMGPEPGSFMSDCDLWVLLGRGIAVTAPDAETKDRLSERLELEARQWRPVLYDHPPCKGVVLPK